MIFSYKYNTNSASQTFPEAHFLWLYRSEVNQGVGQQNLWHSLTSAICPRSRKTNGGKCLWIGPTEFESRVV